MLQAMTLIKARSGQWLLTIFLLTPLAAFPQTVLTGAIQFSTDSAGATAGGQIWNTLGGDSYFDLWLAHDSNASSPINGPADDQAGIGIPLATGTPHTFYIFGAPGCCAEPFNGLNLFFDGNNSTPRISAFEATNSSAFLPDSSSTFTLAAAPVAGSGTTSYRSGDRIVLLTEYYWHTPSTPPGDVCQPESFTPGGGVSYFGSFTLQVFPAAILSLSQPSGSPGTPLTTAGSGFGPDENVDIYANRVGGLLLYTAVTDESGAFSVTLREPQAPYGLLEIYAFGEHSGALGTADFFVTPGILMTPAAGTPGSSTAAQGAGFGSGESVEIYWNNPRQLLGTANANNLGSFLGSDALSFKIPENASPGLNTVIGVGVTTKALGVGEIKVQ